MHPSRPTQSLPIPTCPLRFYNPVLETAIASSGEKRNSRSSMARGGREIGSVWSSTGRKYGKGVHGGHGWLRNRRRHVLHFISCALPNVATGPLRFLPVRLSRRDITIQKLSRPSLRPFLNKYAPQFNITVASIHQVRRHLECRTIMMLHCYRIVGTLAIFTNWRKFDN